MASRPRIKVPSAYSASRQKTSVLGMAAVGWAPQCLGDSHPNAPLLCGQPVCHPFGMQQCFCENAAKELAHR